RVMGFGVFEKAEESMLHDILKICRDKSASRIFVPVCPGSEPVPVVIQSWLQNLGFKPYNTWVKLSRDSSPFEKIAQCELQIRVVGKGDARDFAETVIRGFGYPTTFAPWLELLVTRAGWHTYLAYYGDRPVASGALFVNGRTGYLGLGSTREGFRRRGAQEALIQRRVQDGIALGCKRFFTETTQDTPQNPNPSFHNMLRAGFQLEYARQNFVLQLCEPQK
ncbi:MAG: GNAT family N-acetyltransferase, partial [Nitrososphaerales archaeon]